MSFLEACLGAKLECLMAQKAKAEIAIAVSPAAAPNDMPESSSPAAGSAFHLMSTARSYVSDSPKPLISLLIWMYCFIAESQLAVFGLIHSGLIGFIFNPPLVLENAFNVEAP